MLSGADKDEMVRLHVHEAQSLSTIGVVYGVTRERVRQIMVERKQATLTVERQVRRTQARRFTRAVVLAAKLALRDETRHGKYSTYSQGCRCAPCTEGARVKHRELIGKEPPNHGTASAYRNYYCRCDPCKEAGKRANAEGRAKMKERALALRS